MNYHFVQSKRADVGMLINLCHVIAFETTNAGSTTVIQFHATNGNKYYWKYFNNKEARDKDYEDLLIAAFTPST